VYGLSRSRLFFTLGVVFTYLQLHFVFYRIYIVALCSFPSRRVVTTVWLYLMFGLLLFVVPSHTITGTKVLVRSLHTWTLPYLRIGISRNLILTRQKHSLATKRQGHNEC
jgi:hypothetical protein